MAKYDTFIYDSFVTSYLDKSVKLEFNYEIVGLEKFKHIIEIPVSNKNIDKEYVDNLAFNIGLMEAISYYKLVVSKNFVIKCGVINKEQEEFFRKIYYYGLGEFFYRNNLNPEYESFVTFESMGNTYKKDIDYKGIGSLIAVGGGKDSCVTLSLKNNPDNKAFVVNPKSVMIDCIKTSGINDYVGVKRIIDPKILDLNKQGFLNGHIPFSACVAFISYLSAYLNEKKNIVLSNEDSANEANVAGTKVNHQYSKSIEFENDFRSYAAKYLGGNINYYSFLRPILEYQIGMIFAKLENYHMIFKSCNPGSKEIPWVWCGHCSKCLFVYSLLSPWLYKDKLVNIFGKDLFADEELLDTFLELLGKSGVKPFDCVGTFEEVNYAITKTIKSLGNSPLPYLLQYYKENYYDEDILNKDLEHYWSDTNNLSEEDILLLKEALK